MKQRFAVVTGASRGIGRVAANRLSELGFEVIILARDRALLDSLKSDIESKGRVAHSLQCDLSDRRELASATSELNRFSEIQVLVNNAGFGGDFNSVEGTSNQQWDKVCETNLTASFQLARAVLPQMKAQGFGRLIQISSVYGILTGKGSAAYTSSKHALIGLTKSIAAEYASFGITANAICPGFIETDMIASLDSSRKERLLGRIPAGRFGTPHEVVSLIEFLVGDHASYINGAAIPIDGGLTTHLDVSDEM